MNWIIVWLCLCLFYTGWTQTIDNAKDLATDLLANYSRTVRPRRNQSEAVQVKMLFELLNIQSFDEVQETMTVTAVIALQWTDESMTWNPEDYGGVDEVKFESDQVWTPMLVLLNSVDKLEKLGFKDSWVLVTYINNGTAGFYPGGVLSSKCDVDVKYFPWDKHKCELLFTTWGFNPKHMYITPVSNQVHLTYYTPNGAWDYISSEITTYYDYSLFGMNIILGRKPRFVVVNVISPIVLMAIISAVVFLIPVESGERISYSITMLLAMAVFLTLVGDNLPKTSNPMSIFSYYLISILALNIFISLANIFSLRVYYTSDEQPVGSCWASLTRCLMCTKRKKRKFQYKPTESDDLYLDSKPCSRKEKQNNQMINDLDGSSFFMHGRPTPCERSLSEIQMDIRSESKTLNSSEATRGAESSSQHKNNEPANEKLTWQEVSVAVDKVCFVMSSLSVISLTLVFFFIIWTGGNADV